MPKILKRVGVIKNFLKMKKFKKVQLIAKNLPTGSYAAGCPAEKRGWSQTVCMNCERTM